VSDSLKEEVTPDSAIMIAVINKEVHVAYSLDLTGKYDDIVDILETAAMMVLSEQEKEQSNPSVH
jgi:hypothetical protein